MTRRIILIVLLAFGGCAASLGTLFIDREFHSQDELTTVPMGWPLTFLRQDLSGYTPLDWPQNFAFAQPQDNPVTIHLGWLAVNSLLFMLVAAVSLFAIGRVYQWLAKS